MSRYLEFKIGRFDQRFCIRQLYLETLNLPCLLIYNPSQIISFVNLCPLNVQLPPKNLALLGPLTVCFDDFLLESVLFERESLMNLFVQRSQHSLYLLVVVCCFLELVLC